ncbi:hypothetical protein, partial [Catellatospora sp. NPDC049609]|uniref:hypothetical protein n=1 Tax=Catellatospora sp. NPDC049609 TaxID=3155505 RepID=UPI003412A5B1
SPPWSPTAPSPGETPRSGPSRDLNYCAQDRKWRKDINAPAALVTGKIARAAVDAAPLVQTPSGAAMNDETTEALRGQLLDLAQQMAQCNSAADAFELVQQIAMLADTKQAARASLLTCAQIANNLMAVNETGPLVIPAAGDLARLAPDLEQELRDAATGVNALIYAVAAGQPELTEAALTYLGCGHTSTQTKEEEYVVTALGLMLKFIGGNLQMHGI